MGAICCSDSSVLRHTTQPYTHQLLLQIFYPLYNSLICLNIIINIMHHTIVKMVLSLNYPFIVSDP